MTTSPSDTDEEEYAYPVLSPVLAKYFATGKDLTFLARYQRHGEALAEFEGLADDLRAAMRSPKRAAREINGILGTTFDGPQTRDVLADLLDQMRSTGDHGQSADEDTASEDTEDTKDAKATRPEPQAMFAHYAQRTLLLPNWMGKYAKAKVPLWALFVAGFGVGIIGFLLDLIPWPGPLAVLPGVFALIALLMIGYAALAMFLLRREITQPEKEQAREEAREEHKERRAKRKKVRDLL